MPAASVQSRAISDDENLHLVQRGADIDAINGRFYGRFPYPWRPLNFLYPSNGMLASAMLSQSLGEWDHHLLPAGPAIWVAGCGTNQAVVTALHFPLAAITGSDLSQPSLDLCHQTVRSMGVRNVRLRNESINSADYESDFDFIVCTGVIHHNADPKATLRKLARALKPGGVMELMVYNRFHRFMNTAVQKAVRLLSGGEEPADWNQQMSLLQQMIEAVPRKCEAAEHLACFRGQPDARVADSLLQPVEHSYTIESLNQLAQDCDLEIVTYCVSEWDKAADSIYWNMQWGSDEMQRRYESLPDLERWQVSNLLLFDRSPMLWFYLQRKDSGRPVKSERQMAEEFLDRRFRRARCGLRCFTLENGGSYKLSPKPVPYAGMPASGFYGQLLELCDGILTMREAFERAGAEPTFLAATHARILLATSAFPFLTSGHEHY